MIDPLLYLFQFKVRFMAVLALCAILFVVQSSCLQWPKQCNILNVFQK